jgi:hypothetical protein
MMEDLKDGKDKMREKFMEENSDLKIDIFQINNTGC